MAFLTRKSHNNTRPERATAYEPPGWITTDELESELYAAIVDESSANLVKEDSSFAEIDDYFARADDAEDEHGHRRALLRQLGLLRPQLDEPLGGPAAE